MSCQRHDITSSSFRETSLWNAPSYDSKLTTTLKELRKKNVAAMTTTARTTFALNLDFFNYFVILYVYRIFYIVYSHGTTLAAFAKTDIPIFHKF